MNVGPRSQDFLFLLGQIDLLRVLGGGKPSLPNTRLESELLNGRRFGSGVVFLRYRMSTATSERF